MGWKTAEKRREYFERYNAKWGDVLREKAKARYRENRDAILAKRKAYREANPEAIRTRAIAYQQVKRARRHGLTDSLLERLYEAQGRACALCRQPFPRTGHNGLVIDHDHATDVRRGLLCRPCNIALPMVEQFGREWTERALTYLEAPPIAALAHDQQSGQAIAWAEQALGGRKP